MPHPYIAAAQCSSLQRYGRRQGCRIRAGTAIFGRVSVQKSVLTRCCRKCRRGCHALRCHPGRCHPGPCAMAGRFEFAAPVFLLPERDLCTILRFGRGRRGRRVQVRPQCCAVKREAEQTRQTAGEAEYEERTDPGAGQFFDARGQANRETAENLGPRTQILYRADERGHQRASALARGLAGFVEVGGEFGGHAAAEVGRRQVALVGGPFDGLDQPRADGGSSRIGCDVI